MLIQTFYTGSKLTHRLGKLYIFPAKLRQLYCPQDSTIHLLTSEGNYSSPTMNTRTQILNMEQWTSTNTITAGQPLIEDSKLQTIPNSTPYQHSDIQTWETQIKQQWLHYSSHLLTRTPKNSFPFLDIMSSDTLWLVSDGGLDLDQGYYGWVIADATQIIY